MSKKISPKPLFLILLVYFVVNIVFLRSFWSELFFDRSQVGARYGEVFVAEWAMDKVYENIKGGKNPFAQTNTVLYPFGIDFTTTDSGNGFYFLLLRPFLSEHQSLSIIVALNLLLANIGMYALLRRLRLDRLVSFASGLAFGYMTFLMPRMGHLNYTSTYIFPWFFYFALTLFSSKKTRIKILATIGLSIIFVLSLFLNLYYFVMLIISIGLFIAYYLVFGRSMLYEHIKSNWKYAAGWIFLVLVLLYPWLTALLETRKFEELPGTVGWGGAIQFSSDLFGYFIPSTYSYFLHPVSNFIGTHFIFASHIFEDFTYPGIIILFFYLILLILFLRRKLPKQLSAQIYPFLFVAICFWILTLGPFLHVAGKWGLTVDDGIRIVVPLPFVILHYLPFLSNIRVPGRLIVAFIFFSYVIVAYLLSYFLSKKSYEVKKKLLILFLLLFIVDHYFVISSPAPHFIPNNLYTRIAKDAAKVTVMEAPSTVRDGFVYFGSPDALEFVIGQGIHRKPVLGGYAGRIPYFKTDYYRRNPFLGYIGRAMDTDIKNNGGLDKSDLKSWQKFDVDKSRDAIDFLDLKYFVLDSNKPYSASISAALNSLGFQKIESERSYRLLQRVPDKKEFLSVDIGSMRDDMYLGMGWAARDSGFRWAGRKSSVLFKLDKPRQMTLSFRASSFYRPQQVEIYVNRQKVGKVTVPMQLKEFSIPVESKKFVVGINFVHFIFENSLQPKDVIPGSADARNLSAKFTKVYLSRD